MITVFRCTCRCSTRSITQTKTCTASSLGHAVSSCLCSSFLFTRALIVRGPRCGHCVTPWYRRVTTSCAGITDSTLYKVHVLLKAVGEREMNGNQGWFINISKIKNLPCIHHQYHSLERKHLNRMMRYICKHHCRMLE